jgi:hypothetical protein
MRTGCLDTLSGLHDALGPVGFEVPFGGGTYGAQCLAQVLYTVYAEEIGDELGAVWCYAEFDEPGEELVDLRARRESFEFA